MLPQLLLSVQAIITIPTTPKVTPTTHTTHPTTTVMAAFTTAAVVLVPLAAQSMASVAPNLNAEQLLLSATSLEVFC
jgi:hypothetical protein